KSALAQAEETLREQRQSLDDLLTHLEEGVGVAEAERDGEADKLRQENECLRRLLADRATAAESGDDELVRLRHENEDLRHLLAAVEHERERAEAAVAEVRAGMAQAAPQPDTAEIDTLRRQLAEHQTEIERLQCQRAQASEHDVENYEAELNEF